MNHKLLEQAGLTPTQADILGYLFTVSSVKAKDAVDALNKPRGVIYKGLEELVGLGLAEKIEKPGAIARFRAEHPSKLEALFEAKEKAAQIERQNFLSNLPSLSSQYNLNQTKPVISCVEGERGKFQTESDIRHGKKELLVFVDKADTELLDECLERFRIGIRQRVIVAGKPAKKGLKIQNLHEVRYIDNPKTPFNSSIKIYDNKIAYETEDSGNPTTITIEDKNIYEMNKAWFEFLWQLAE